MLLQLKTDSLFCPCFLAKVKANLPAMCIVVQVRQGEAGEQIQQEAFSKLLSAQPPLSQI